MIALTKLFFEGSFMKMFNMGSVQSIDDIVVENIDDMPEGFENHLDSDSSDDYVLDANETVSSPFVFQESALSEVEEQLDIDERVSLTYILYANPTDALNKISELLLNPESTEVLVYWYNKNRNSHNAQNILLEALSIIQNYEVLKILTDQDKNQLISRFLPRRKYSCINVNHFRKVIYLICEDLNAVQAKPLRDYVKKHLKQRFIDFEYMEQYFLQWENLGYINSNNYSNLLKAFKELDMFDFYGSLENLKLNFNITFDDKTTNTVHSVSQSVSDSQQNGTIKAKICNNKMDSKYDNETAKDNMYKVNPDAPGVCLIINQKSFHKEFDRKYGPQPEKSLEYRTGSEKDRDKLMETFEMYNFKIILEENLLHNEIIDRIDRAAMEVGNYSTFFVIILSHGIEGHVYGSNSLPLSVNDIYDSLNKARCQAKVLILQACQGNVCQEMETEDLETDGPTNSMAPSYRDMLVFWATVPGYAAIRDCKNGSWFIQTLCDKIKSYADVYHFEDICTLVRNEISNKCWNKNNKKYGIVPIVFTTFKKFLHFPLKKN